MNGKKAHLCYALLYQRTSFSLLVNMRWNNPNSINSLPEEVWRIIWSNLGAIDKLNFCRSSQYVDEMLGGNSSQWLLGEILPFILPHLSNKRDVLLLRRICKDWLKTVDQFLETGHMQRRPWDMDNIVEKVAACKRSTCSSLNQLDLLHHRITPENSSKFITCVKLVGRSVSFTINSDWDSVAVNGFMRQALEFLRSPHGSKILHFSFVTSNIHLPSTRFYHVLQECLSTLPNILTLEIVHNVIGDISELSDVISDMSLPPLPHLHTIKLDVHPAVYDVFFARYSSQIRKISTAVDYYHVDFHFPEHTTELAIRRVDTSICLFSIYKCIEAKNMTRVKKFTLELTGISDVELYLILQILQHFPNLVFFKLLLSPDVTACTYITCRQCDFKRFKHPNVWFYEVQGTGNALLTFSHMAYAFPSLKCIHVQDVFALLVQPAIQYDKIYDINRCIIEKKLYKSVIWDILPSLQVFTYYNVNGCLNQSCHRATANLWKLSRYVFQLFKKCHHSM